MKNNISYFRHETESYRNVKFKTLRLKFGWEGEGRFWALNSMIADSNDCRLDLGKKFVKADVATELGISLEEFDEFIEYLKDECELLVSDGDTITTKDVQEVFQQVMKKRNRDRRTYEKTAKAIVPSVETKKPIAEKKKSATKTIKKTIEKGLMLLIETDYPRVNKLKSPLTEDQAKKLETEFEPEAILDVLSGMENKADLLKKYTSANLTMRNWLDRRGTGKKTDWENLSLEEGKKMLSDPKSAELLQLRNPELFFKCQNQ